jgi:hypothetical protein
MKAQILRALRPIVPSCETNSLTRRPGEGRGRIEGSLHLLSLCSRQAPASAGATKRS